MPSFVSPAACVGSCASGSVEMAVSVPGLRAFRMTSVERIVGVKEYYTIGRVESGTSEYWTRGRLWQSGPGSIQVKEPGDVHRDVALHGARIFTAITLPGAEVLRVRDEGKVVAMPHLDPNDERALPFHRLQDAVAANADRLTIEVALAEAINAMARFGRTDFDRTRPVRRAMEYLRERLSESITLDDLATHAALDKFHLCRAFRAQIGMPPHTYLTHLRIQRAKELLAKGVRASELAPHVGLYDQSQLTRHFRRIVGTTPARYASTRLAI